MALQILLNPPAAIGAGRTEPEAEITSHGRAIGVPTLRPALPQREGQSEKIAALARAPIDLEDLNGRISP